MRLTTAIGFTKNLPKMLEKVLSLDGTFFLPYSLKLGAKVSIIQLDKLEFFEHQSIFFQKGIDSHAPS